MIKINFQDEFINKYKTILKYPYISDYSGYCIYKGNIPYSFIDFFSIPKSEYIQYLLEVQYYANYYNSKLSDHITWRLENLSNYVRINKSSPHIVSVNGYADIKTFNYINEYNDLLNESTYTFGYVNGDGIYPNLNETRYTFQSDFNYKYIVSNSVLEIPLIKYSQEDYTLLESIIDKFNYIILRDVEVNNQNKFYDNKIYKNINWYISSYETLDIMSNLYFSKNRTNSIFYWSSDVDRLLNPSYEGSTQFNFLEMNTSVFKRIP